MRRSRTVNVVGAGPGGLASAMLLAAEGFDVEVFEKRGHVGGRTSVMDLDGYRFDRGPTFFLYPQILEQVFARCGRSLHDEIELIRLDPNYRLVFEEGGVIDATSDVERMRAQLAEINPADAAALDGYLRANRDKLEAFRPILERPFLSHLDLLSLPLDQVLPLRRSVDDDLKRHFSDQRVRLGFSFQSKYLGMSPFRCPSLFTILAFLEYEHGVFHPAGGCGAVTEAMARVAREMGVRIHLNRPIRQVELEGRRAVGVWTDEGLHRADAHVI
ncbi:MAG: phytoene desaturase family protein, partial [Pseudomonadota bacterium]